MFNSELKRGSLELLILALLKDGRRHGYDIGKTIAAESDGALKFSVSTLYPILYRLAERGWIECEWADGDGERKRCYYTLTSAGKKVLVTQQENWRNFAAVVNHIIGAGNA